MDSHILGLTSYAQVNAHAQSATFFTSTKTTCVVAGLQIGLWPGSCFQLVFDPKESKRKSSRLFSFVHPYP